MLQKLRQAFGLLSVSVIVFLATAGCGSTDSTDAAVSASISGGEAGDSAAAVAGTTPKVNSPPTVRIDTTLGMITVVLDPEKAPLTVRNFLSYVENGHYEGTIFHQVVDGYITLGGAYTKELQEKPAQDPIRNEAHNGLPNRRGAIAMARQHDAIDSSTCQFFINLADNADLDHKDRESAAAYGYCVFGRVIEGLEVVEKIGKTPVQTIENFEMIPAQAVVIRSVRRIR